MKFKSLLAALLLIASYAGAQTSDPVVMTINGKPVLRSEFEYSYNKNNSETVVDKKNVDEYVPLFVNYKLKVLAAEAAGIDTTGAFRNEFTMYRNQQVRPSFINDDDVENEARRIYKETQTRIDEAGGLVHPFHILVTLKQSATEAEQNASKMKADSIYNVLKKGASFEDLAKRLSDDKGSARHGGDLSWVQKGQTVKEFEQKIFAMKPGELSEPFLSPFGYHIVLLKEKQNFFSYDSMRTNIRQFIEQRGIREQIISHKLDSLAEAAKPKTTPAKLLEQRAEEMAANDPNLRTLIREYHDGLLLYEISNRTVWERAAKDEKGLAAMFKKNRKRYKWTEPRFKGIAYNCKNEADVEAVKAAIKKIDFNDWAETLRKQFNDSTLRIKVVKGIFKKGDNALVDRDVFHKDTTYTAPKDFSYTAVYGTTMKAPKTYEDVRELVVADYQEQLEKQWIAELRRQYPVVINQEALATVNKH